jgi:DNA polymerase-3 subunit epsilon
MAQRYLVIDTETTGLFDFAKAADAEGQPRMASVALLFCDENFDVVHEVSLLVRPDGWMMSAEAERIHGLSQEMLLARGVRVMEVLALYEAAIIGGLIIVAHNVQYDTKIMRGEMRRAGMSDRYHETATICTMKALVDVCRIPKAKGRGFKWPKLTEAVRKVLHRDHKGAHGALPDAQAARELARWLLSNKRLPSSTKPALEPEMARI